MNIIFSLIVLLVLWTKNDSLMIAASAAAQNKNGNSPEMNCTVVTLDLTTDRRPFPLSPLVINPLGTDNVIYTASACGWIGQEHSLTIIGTHGYHSVTGEALFECEAWFNNQTYATRCPVCQLASSCQDDTAISQEPILIQNISVVYNCTGLQEDLECAMMDPEESCQDTVANLPHTNCFEIADDDDDGATVANESEVASADETENTSSTTSFGIIGALVSVLLIFLL